MQQNNIWINYLRLGISVLFIFLLSSCKKNINSRADWLYINETEHEIEVHLTPIPHDDDFTIKPLDKVILHGKIVFADVKITDFTTPWIYCIKYDDIKCDTVRENETVRVLSNYESEELGDNYYQYTYRFTEADYERAVKCE